MLIGGLVKGCSTHADVLVRFVDEPLVDLVRDTKDVPFAAKLPDEFQFLAAENFAKRIVWRIHYNCFGLFIKLGRQFSLIESPVSRRRLCRF